MGQVAGNRIEICFRYQHAVADEQEAVSVWALAGDFLKHVGDGLCIDALFFWRRSDPAIRGELMPPGLEQWCERRASGSQSNRRKPGQSQEPAP